MVFNTCGKVVEISLFSHIFSAFLTFFCSYGIQNLCGIRKPGKSGKHFIFSVYCFFFLPFPQEFSTHRKSTSNQQYQNTDLDASKKRFSLFLLLFSLFYQLLLHTKKLPQSGQKRSHISLSVSFHSFRRHY